MTSLDKELEEINKQVDNTYKELENVQKGWTKEIQNDDLYKQIQEYIRIKKTENRIKERLEEQKRYIVQKNKIVEIQLFVKTILDKHLMKPTIEEMMQNLPLLISVGHELMVNEIVYPYEYNMKDTQYIFELFQEYLKTTRLDIIINTITNHMDFISFDAKNV
jgi:hypothetical protein